MTHPITIVLPMTNAESLVQRSVTEVLELAYAFDGEFSIVVVDNGSTDETYETACELAATYPQVTVLRQPVQRALPRVLETVRSFCRCEAVVVHDGMAPVDVEQLRGLLLATEDQQRVAVESSASGSRRFGALRKLQANMESAHGSIAGFRWMKLEKPLLPRRVEATSTTIVTAMPNMPLTESMLPIN